MTIDAPASVNLSKYIETRFFDQRPHVRNRRIPVAIVVYQARANGWTIARTAYNFSISEAEVLAAMLYYAEHQQEIDAQEAEEARLFEEMKREYGGA